MTTEEHDEGAASEQPEIESGDTQQQEPVMVPLAALQAERKKRQELEIRNKIYEEMQNKSKAEQEPEEDPEALLTKGTYQEEKALTKREILEQVYADMNPKAVQKVNTYLKQILDKKPWLASSLDTAPNRLARASEIVDDYMHLLDDKPKTGSQDAQRILENARKPRSPVETGKSAQPSGTEYLKSIQGKKEFREYRQKVLNGEI